MIVDTPPRSSEAALAAARAADVILIPIRPQLVDLETVPDALTLIRTANAGRPDPARVAVVLNATTPRGDRTEQAATAIRGMGAEVCPATLGQRAIFGDANVAGLSAQEMDPRSRAAEEIKELYKAVVKLAGKPTVRPAAKTARRKSA